MAGLLCGACPASEPVTIVTPPIGPITYALSVESGEPFERPVPVPAPMIYIDGEARTSFEAE